MFFFCKYLRGGKSVICFMLSDFMTDDRILWSWKMICICKFGGDAHTLSIFLLRYHGIGIYLYAVFSSLHLLFCFFFFVIQGKGS